ncbi:MAG: hypothetical protein EP335_11830 [Alphaproteobacteria bacterium]|nr:MAG: hypothetical protein EP335_11830 [Alphaproteobacteria bacterium]
MPILSKLKFSDQTRTGDRQSPEARKREKLLTNIEHQVKHAEAEKKGEEYAYQDFRHVRNVETGERTRQRVSVKVRPWFWCDAAGKCFTYIKYGNKTLELAKGKKAIEVGTRDNLVPTLNQIAEAVRAGELDTVIAGAAAFGAKLK